MAQARLHERSLRNPLAAPALAAVVLAPVVAWAATTSAVSTVGVAWAAAITVIGTANVALGLPRLGVSNYFIGAASVVTATDFGIPEVVGLNAAAAVFTVLVGVLLVWSFRADESAHLGELVDEAHAARGQES